MPEINPKCFHMSASSIGAFKACPTRFRLAYREGLRLASDTDSQRQGTAWHAMHEAYAKALDAVKEGIGGDEPWPVDDAKREYSMNAVVSWLNERYATCPSHKTLEEWELERTILMVSFIAYQWHYAEDQVQFLASELPFELPLRDPRVNMPLSTDEVKVVGKIDHVVKWQGAVCNLERKSTSRSISDDSDYWERCRKDTQVSMYALAFRDMQYTQTNGNVWLRSSENEILVDLGNVPRAGNTLYDVWHKPTIKPAMLTQAETKAFIESGEYCGQKFKVAVVGTADPRYFVDEVPVAIEQGKKGFAIRETAAMYGARLMQDIYSRPDFYFRRKEIARTDADLIHFRKQLYVTYQAQKACAKLDAWVENESACRATFACPFIPICYGPGADAVCDGKTTPPNFKRIFVDLTVNGETIEEA